MVKITKFSASIGSISTEKNGDIRVFTFSIMEVIDGEGKGSKSPDSFSYVYRVYDDRFFEVAGLLPGQEEPVTVFSWKRVKKEAK